MKPGMPLRHQFPQTIIFPGEEVSLFPLLYFTRCMPACFPQPRDGSSVPGIVLIDGEIKKENFGYEEVYRPSLSLITSIFRDNL